jgi:hypothetical protein
MIWRYIFQDIGSSGAPPTSRSRWGSLTQLLRCYAPTYIRSSGAEDLATKSPLLASIWPSDRPTLSLTKVSDHPVLKASSWHVSVWIQTERRIDRRCPHSGRRIIRCYCLPCSSSATRPMLLKIGPSVHPTVPRVSPSEPTRPTIAPTLVIEGPSVHPTMSFLFLFLLGFDPCFSHFDMWFSCILGT